MMTIVNGIGGNVDTIGQLFLNSDTVLIVGDIISKRGSLQNEVDDSDTNVRWKKVSIVDVEQVILIARELMMNLVFWRWKEQLVESNAFVNSIKNRFHCSHGLRIFLQDFVGLVLFQSNWKFEFQYLRIATEHLERNVDLQKVNILRLIAVKQQAFDEQILLEDLSSVSMSVVWIISQDKVHICFVLPENLLCVRERNEMISNRY